jgi:protein-L-isoaspartate(D-aspartate) O-methyltransferase
MDGIGGPGIESIELERIRRYYAEEIAAYCSLRSDALVEALASVPREQFLGPGPWLIRGIDADLGAPARLTRNDDPRHVYHNVAIAIDPARMLFNGQPGTLALWIDALQLKPGERVLHIGCATGYYSALMAHLVGPAGKVTAMDVDAGLAKRAQENLMTLPWVEVREANGTSELPENVDAIFINAGVTHPLPVWLDALRDGGRMILPVTFTVDKMPTNIGKGGVFLITRQQDAFEVRFLSMVAIYSALGVRDAAMNERLPQAFSGMTFLKVRHLRRDVHELGPACWLHGTGVCLTTE